MYLLYASKEVLILRINFVTLSLVTNGIGNKQVHLRIFLEAHNVKVAAIQESKLTAQSRSPNIQELDPSTTGSTPMPRRRLNVGFNP